MKTKKFTWNFPPDMNCKARTLSYDSIKQARQWWYDSLSCTLNKLRFYASHADPGVFLAWKNGENYILAIHIDDCTFMCPLRAILNEYKQKINEKYSITELGSLHWLLGIKIKWDHKQQIIHLSQTSYIDSIVWRFFLNNLKPISAPMEPGATFMWTNGTNNSTDTEWMKWMPYREAIGSLMYTSMATQPDITFTIPW